MRNQRLREIGDLAKNTQPLGLGQASHKNQPAYPQLKSKGAGRAVGQLVSVLLFLCVSDWRRLELAQVTSCAGI